MKLNTAMQRIPHWYESKRSIYLKGPPGIGKTEIVSEAPALLSKRFNQNIGAVVINGPLLTIGDAIGYLMPDKQEDGRMESRYTDPPWFRTYENKRLSEFDGGIILVDEMDKADVDVKKILGEAALSGRLGPHKLSGNWVLWGTGNRAEDRSGSTKEFDHLINRRLELDITPDLDAWTDWALTHGVTPLTVSFANTYPDIVLSGKVPEKQGPWCTPRSLVNTDRYLQLLARDNGGDIPEDESTVEEVNGMIGGASGSYFSHVKLQQEMPKFEKIVADPTKAKLSTKPDVQMLTCYNLAHKVDKETIAPVITYIERMSPEFAVTFAKSAVKRDASLVMSQAMNKWTQRNASLMAAITEHDRSRAA